MPIHRSITAGLVFCSVCAPLLGAAQHRSEFWFVAPDSRPGAFYRDRDWNAKVVFGQAAAKDARPNRNVRQAFAWSEKPVDPFTVMFFAAELEGAEQLDDTLGIPDHPNPRERQSAEPSVIASPVVGCVLFAIGLAGWITLGISAFLLDRSRGAHKSV